MKNNFVTKSFKHKLRATYTLLMFIVLIIMGALIYYQVENIIKPLIQHDGLKVIDSEAKYIGGLFADQANMLRQLAGIEIFKDGDFEAIKKEINNQMKDHNNSWISMKYKSVTGNEEYADDLSDFQTVHSYEQELLSENNLTLISQPVVEDRNSEYTAYIGTKVKDNNGNLKGLLIVKTSLKQILKPFLDTQTGKFTERWFLDSQGNVIIQPNSQTPPIPKIENFRGKISTESSGEVKVSNRKEEANSLLYAPIPNVRGLYLAVGIEHSESLNDMRFLLWFMTDGILLASLLIFITANKMTNLMTKPLTRIVEIIQHSDGSNLLEIPADLKSSKDEIGILANTIDEMARNIRNNVNDLNSEIEERQKAEKKLIFLNDELECRVNERTRALTEVTHILSISEDRFRIAMEASQIGLYDLDCNNNVTVVNGIFLKLLKAPAFKQNNIKESDWVRFNEELEDYVYENDRLNKVQFKKEKLVTENDDFYIELRLKEHPDIWLSFIGQVIKRDEAQKILRFIGVLQNISERKRGEVKLKEAIEESKEACEAKSQFLANMSHEIRTPMNAIMGLTHLIGQSGLNDFQKNYISKIEKASTILLRIINDILDFSKIEAGKLEVEEIEFSLEKVLENVSNLCITAATNKGINLNFKIGEGVPNLLIGDPFRLEQVLSNLTTNAIKFTAQGKVDVSVQAVGQSEDEVKLYFSVVDTGIGLTEDQIDKLFTAFTQADGSMSRKYGGTGLGLTISKQLVELMNGDIWVDSVYGEGAAFQFILQLVKPSDIIETTSTHSENYNLMGRKALKSADSITYVNNRDKKYIDPDFKLDKALLELEKNLEKARTKDIKASINYLMANTDNLPFSSQIHQVKQLVDRYHYKEAKTKVIEIIEHIKESNHG